MTQKIKPKPRLTRVDHFGLWCKYLPKKIYPERNQGVVFEVENLQRQLKKYFKGVMLLGCKWRVKTRYLHPYILNWALHCAGLLPAFFVEKGLPVSATAP